MPYQGSCHCGAVAFTVTADLPAEVYECNCSICRRKGLLLTFVPATAFTLDSGEASLGRYRFYKHRITHRFCTTCGTEPFAEGEQNGQPMRAVNIRCVPAADLAAIPRKAVNGAAF
ncbi:GFA family protein [Paragemmobacter straminiformis]|uniref:GFA family protein n=1 Tax=Paragemmobacter straminiformis TaxID=2045119 RepID=A0A842I4Y2_9RHOB|nr:GFA family protein [Gemmobacter straminiformis]MBC2834447.1 GFA family protein [Gemmobacter straminiformis]